MQKENWEVYVRDAIEAGGFEVVEIRSEKRAKFSIIKAFIDKDGGITVDDCSTVSRLVNDEMFKHNIMNNDYRLEVSSPGADRPLMTCKDFKRNVSRKALVTFQKDGKTETVEGKIVSADERELLIEGAREKHAIPMDSLVAGKIKLPW